MSDKVNQSELDALIDNCLEGNLSETDAAKLSVQLEQSAEVRTLYWEMASVHGLLEHALQNASLRAVSGQTLPIASRPQRWLQCRPFTAAAMGLVIVMFSASVVFGFVVQRAVVVKIVPLAVYDPGLEKAEPIVARGVPNGVGQWGADSATVVSAENGVQPLEGKQMLRLEPIPPEKKVKNHASRVYQVLDLRSLPKRGIADDVEVQVTASFFAINSDVTSRYFVRAFALNETPEQATRGFWPKTHDDGVVSVAQRFETPPGDRRWHTFSLKMPLPRGAQSRVFILGVGPADDATVGASAHYLDDVRVSVLTTQAPQP